MFRKSYLFYSVPLLFITGCAPLYTPNVIHAPLFSQKNDADIQLGTGTCGYDAQVAYAPTNYLGVMVNGSFKDKETTDTNYYHKHNFIEAGVGYYGKIGDAGRYECYAGYGNAQAESFVDGFYGLVKGRYNRFFIQPSIGAKTDIFDGAFSLRIVYINMYDVSKNVGYTPSQLSAYYYEPVLTGRIGYKFVKFFIQGGLSIPFQTQLKYTDSPFIINWGFHFNFSESYLSKKK